MSNMMSSNITTSNFVVDNNWYLDLGATHHFTPDYSKLTSATPFTRSDQVAVGDGKKISISHVRYVALPNSSHSLLLNHICHTPIISNNLISVSKLCRDNKAFVEFHPDYFLVKDQDTQYPPPGTHWLWPLQSLLTTILLMPIHFTF